jgi:Transposase DNA-binding
MSLPYETEVILGQAIFGHAELGDKRRTARLVETFDLMRRHPGGTLPDKLSTPADLRAFYRLCNAEEVTHAAIIAAARQYTLARIADCSGPVVIVQDATELDYSTLSSLADDLGQIGNGGCRGYVCQNVLAIDADSREVLGLIDQILHHRDEVPEHETLAEHRERETRESLLWLHGTEHLPEDRKLVDASDQGSDSFEFLEHELHSGRRFVVRACKVRKVYAGHQPLGPRHYLKPYAESLPERGRFTMDVQAQPGRKARQNAEFTVRGGPVLVCPPHAAVRGADHGGQPARGREGHRLDVADQRTGGDLRGCLAGCELVRVAMDCGGISQGEKDGLPNRRHAIHDHRPTGTGDRAAVRGGGDAVEPARRQPSRRRPYASGDRGHRLGLRGGAEPLAIPESPRGFDRP